MPSKKKSKAPPADLERPPFRDGPPDEGESAEGVAAVHALVLADPVEGGPPLPEMLPLLPLRSDVVFPQTVVPLVVNRSSGIKLIDEVLIGDKMIGLVTQRHPDDDEPGLGDLYPTVCVGSVLKMLKFPDGSTRIVCQGLFRARLIEIVQTEPFLIGQDRAAARTSSRRGSSSTRWCTTSARSSSAWSTRASRCPRSSRSPR